MGRACSISFAISFLVVSSAWLTPLHAEQLVIPGTGSAETILRELAKDFNARGGEHQVVVPPSTGSDSGIRGVDNNEVFLARVSKPLKEADLKKGLRYRPFARDAVIFATGEGVKVKNVSTAQLIDIFSGKARSWADVGGNPAPIRVFIREKIDSKYQVILEHVEPFRALGFSGQAKMLHHTYEMIAMLDRFDKGVGWITRSTLTSGKSRLRSLSLDGVEASTENVASGKYRLAIDFGLVYKESRLNDASRTFIDYIDSDAGRKVMEKAGLVYLARSPS